MRCRVWGLGMVGSLFQGWTRLPRGRLHQRCTSAPNPETSPSQVFAEMAEAHDVPADLLLAIARTETGMQFVGESEFLGQEPAFGWMALRGAHLKDGAELAGVTVEAAQPARCSCGCGGGTPRRMGR